MLQRKPLAVAVRAGLGLTAALLSAQAISQVQQGDIEEVVVTGTHIKLPGTVSASPVTSVGIEEINFRQDGEVERILKVLPSMAFGDGANVNNGTAGVSTLNLRGLGSQRNLILINSKRVTPYDPNGIVDVSNIPTALIERIDVVTGGASAVYGSDAISGAINFVLKDDFEGVALDTNYSETEDYSGDIRNVALTLGANVADGRGNVTATFNWTDRDGVLLGSQALGRLGIGTTGGGGLSAYYDGASAPAPTAGCGGPNATSGSGSGTTMPTRVNIAGVGGSGGQFRDDRTLSSRCSSFNFNPWNYYQTPQEREGGMVVGHFDINEHATAYASGVFNSTKVDQQIAPSGIFAFTNLWTPVANPFLSTQARNLLLTQANAAIATGALVDGQNWRDLNGNGVVDFAASPTAADYGDELLIGYARRTPEIGPRSTNYSNDYYQIVAGMRGDIMYDWTYDISYSYGESDRTNESAGYTNNTNLTDAVRTIDGTNCLDSAQATCVPIDLFGGFGTITGDMAGFAGANAFTVDHYDQRVVSAIFTGPIAPVQLPTASNPLNISVGYENREDNSDTRPDVCWQQGCLGGAGGTVLPVGGGYKVEEFFGELLFPLVNDKPFAKDLTFEAGYRVSDYDVVESSDTWKYGLNWRPIDSLMFRAMKQRAVRAPNVGELFSPVVKGLDNSNPDPCASDPATGAPRTITDPVLIQRCLDTGMTPQQIGTVPNIVAGQIDTFQGSNPNDLPQPEESDSTTIGFVWTPDTSAWWSASTGTTLTVDYYDIDVDGYIDEITPNEVLKGCYELGLQAECDKIHRDFGVIGSNGGIDTFTENLEYIQVEGVEFALATGITLGDYGTLSFSGNLNWYLTQEYESSPVIGVVDCLGKYGASCGAPLPWVRFIQRTTWEYQDFMVSAQWRYFGETQIENAQATYQPNKGLGTFPKFQEIDAWNYLDLFASYTYRDTATISFGVDNVFAKHPPVVGNQAADTASNSGNTFPSQYDTLGRVYRMGVDVRF